MMSIWTKVCCGCRSRSTSLVTAFYSIFMAVTCMSLMLLQNSTKKRQGHQRDVPAISYVSLAVYSLLIVFSFILIAGANLGRVCVYIPWIANMVAVIGFEATTMGLEYAPTYHPPSELRSWDAFYIVFYIVRTFLNIYFSVSITVQCYCSIRPDDDLDLDESAKDPYDASGELDLDLETCSAGGAASNIPESLSMEYDPMLLTPLQSMNSEDAEVIYNENATWDDISVEEKKTLIESDEECKFDNIVENMDIEVG